MELGEWIADRFRALDGTNYYHLLGVAREATPDEIQAAFYRLAERLHPDRYGDVLEDDTRRMLVALYSRLVEAHRVLSDGRKRAEYEKLLDRGKLRWSAEEAPRKDPEAEIHNPSARRFFKLGRAALLSGDAKNAVTNLRFALDVEPDSAIVRAELAKAEALAKENG
ncbi:MAG TPA: J domain-containing protein [Haliangiales bacterium]|nr:J domain-containing protein [Haliangiales bacterium]